jgi:hypothetical protein
LNTFYSNGAHELEIIEHQTLTTFKNNYLAINIFLPYLLITLVSYAALHFFVLNENCIISETACRSIGYIIYLFCIFGLFYILYNFSNRVTSVQKWHKQKVDVEKIHIEEFQEKRAFRLLTSIDCKAVIDEQPLHFKATNFMNMFYPLYTNANGESSDPMAYMKEFDFLNCHVYINPENEKEIYFNINVGGYEKAIKLILKVTIFVMSFGLLAIFFST